MNIAMCIWKRHIFWGVLGSKLSRVIFTAVLLCIWNAEHPNRFAAPSQRQKAGKTRNQSDNQNQTLCTVPGKDLKQKLRQNLPLETTTSREIPPCMSQPLSSTLPSQTPSTTAKEQPEKTNKGAKHESFLAAHDAACIRKVHPCNAFPTATFTAKPTAVPNDNATTSAGMPTIFNLRNLNSFNCPSCRDYTTTTPSPSSTCSYARQSSDTRERGSQRARRLKKINLDWTLEIFNPCGWKIQS